MQIQRSRSLKCQGITDGSEISFVWISISAEQQRDVVEKMQAGHFISEEDMDTLNSIVDLFWFDGHLDNLLLPSGLQRLAFGIGFNQSLDKTTLPSGLRSLTFGVGFSQNLDGTTLPSGLMLLGLSDDDADESRLPATRPCLE